MDSERPTPFKCHIFVCINDRKGERLSCADTGGKEIKDRLKVALKAEKLPPGSVRLSQSGCLGICECGPNVMIYPQEILYSNVTLDDVGAIVARIKELTD